MPFADGVHLPWSDVPDRIREWLTDWAGSEIAEARDMSGGFSPGCCTCLGFAGGRQVFLKAVSRSANPESPEMHRREARVARHLPPAPGLPRLVGYLDEDGWVALVFDRIDGRLPRHPWVDRELDLVVEHLGAVHDLLTPCPAPDLESTATYFEAMFGGWRALAAAPVVPQSLDPWSRRHLDRLAGLEERWGEAVDGDVLVHGDIRSDNILVTGSSVVFVDWPHASRGAAFFDVVAWAPSVALEGGPEPESLLHRFPTARDVDAGQLDPVVAAVAGFFTHHATLPPPPGLPTLRRFQAAQGRVARDWLRRRTGWP
ncbi:MAG TPA: phosphotransferase [Acidimicrobiales bacterium]|nr:phosphotransferase [Acidimicrobiales bacterium]